METRCDLLKVFLLGSTEYEEMLRLQRRLAYQLSENRTRPCLILCEHPPLITVGRHGGPPRLHPNSEDFSPERWKIRWVQRGGDTLLHLPGQLCIYPILPLDRLELGISEYLERLQRSLIATLDDFGIRAEAFQLQKVEAQKRVIAEMGVNVHEAISTFGAVLNVDPDLSLLKQMYEGGRHGVTSIVRERRGPLRPAHVRERFLDHFGRHLGYTQMDFIFSPPIAQPSRQLPTAS